MEFNEEEDSLFSQVCDQVSKPANTSGASSTINPLTALANAGPQVPGVRKRTELTSTVTGTSSTITTEAVVRTSFGNSIVIPQAIPSTPSRLNRKKRYTNIFIPVTEDTYWGVAKSLSSDWEVV